MTEDKPAEPNLEATSESDEHRRAEQQVAATTDSYGGPVSEDELAEVYLPDGQDQVNVGQDRAGDDENQERAEKDQADEDPTEKATRLIVG